MNYSASEAYSAKCNHFRQHSIQFSEIKKRWFRNHYVLYQTRGWFTHNCFTFDTEQALKLDKYPGTWYGPFWTKDAADDFARSVERTHTNFILG
jgi:hypothetical protein